MTPPTYMGNPGSVLPSLHPHPDETAPTRVPKSLERLWGVRG